MLQPIFDFISSFWDAIFCSWWFVTAQYMEGVVLRFGNYNRTVTSSNGIFRTGLHFKWPIAEEYIDKTVVVTTMDLDPQSLTTRDGKSIVVSAVVKYRISDVKAFLLEIADQQAAIQDITMAKIREVISKKEWSEISTQTDLEIAEKVRYETGKYGITIEPKGVTLKDLQPCRSIRLLQDVPPTEIAIETK
jgi:membrane protease subunit HflK